MKKITFALFLFFSIIGCNNEKEINDPNDTAEVSFNLDLLGNPDQQTKSFTTELGTCVSNEDLINLANSGHLFLNITIDTSQKVKIIWNGNSFISDPIMLSSGSYEISQAVVVDQNNNLLFSAVGNSSIYASYVVETLPKTISVGTKPGDIPLYSKSKVDLYMLCVLNETAEKFGFVKWNVHFSKVYCLPFVINVCTNVGEHFIGQGNIKVQNGTYVNNVFTPATGNEDPKLAVVNKTTIFPDPNSGYGNLCFVDNYEIDNLKEYYKITIDITSPIGLARKYTGYANVSTLIKYSTSSNNAWDQANNIIHFDFCNCKTWFFSCIPDREPDPNPDCYCHSLPFLEKFSYKYPYYMDQSDCYWQVAPLSEEKWYPGLPELTDFPLLKWAGNETATDYNDQVPVGRSVVIPLYNASSERYKLRSPIIDFNENTVISFIYGLNNYKDPVKCKLISPSTGMVSEEIVLTNQYNHLSAEDFSSFLGCLKIQFEVSHYLDEIEVREIEAPLASFFDDFESYTTSDLYLKSKQKGWWSYIPNGTLRGLLTRGSLPQLTVNPDPANGNRKMLNCNDGDIFFTPLITFTNVTKLSLDVKNYATINKSPSLYVRIYDAKLNEKGNVKKSLLYQMPVQNFNINLSEFGVPPGNYRIGIEMRKGIVETNQTNAFYIDKVSIQ